MPDTPLTTEELRAQRDQIERQIAAASVDAATAFVALLASPETDALMGAMSAAVENLDEPTRKRVAAWVKMRTDIATIAKIDLAKMRGLVAADLPATA